MQNSHRHQCSCRWSVILSVIMHTRITSLLKLLVLFIYLGLFYTHYVTTLSRTREAPISTWIYLTPFRLWLLQTEFCLKHHMMSHHTESPESSLIGYKTSSAKLKKGVILANKYKSLLIFCYAVSYICCFFRKLQKNSRRKMWEHFPAS